MAAGKVVPSTMPTATASSAQRTSAVRGDESSVRHARYLVVRGRATVRPSSRRTIAPRASLRSTQVESGRRPADDDRLGPGLGGAGRPGDHGRLDDVGPGGGPVAGSMRWWRPSVGPQRWTLVPDVATPYIRASRDPPGEHEHGEDCTVVARVADADLPVIAGRGPHRDIPIGIDERALGAEEGQRAIGEPSLAHAVEVEALPEGPGHDGAAMAARGQVPQVGSFEGFRWPGPIGRRRIRAGGSDLALGPEARGKERDVDRSSRERRCLASPGEGGRQRWPDRHVDPGIRVQAHQP